MKAKSPTSQTIPTHLLNQIAGGYKVNNRYQNRNRMERDGLVHTCPQVIISGIPPY
ncbi:hypothetical protein [Pseudoalteromonas sp. S16_S37]|uniref:hypothetical protein n=1 Tax=Pseudoalteromonas sp. S16_S37 TaxID=2720228 RepID=UPI0016815499|nr:hypothetical protein [Pseudoalteromonas sp. S16_S37]MBD1584411.1 hypothetical protein [Pseudoalteromonas sp. S16_S37]